MSEKPAGAEKKVAAGVCGILLGALGVHKFILGYTKEGLIMLLVSFLTVGILALVMEHHRTDRGNYLFDQERRGICPNVCH